MVIKTYKGMDKHMQCRGFQYKIGKTYGSGGAVVCESGIHSCEAPFDALRYYPSINGNRFFECEASGDISKSSDGDTKLSSTVLRVCKEVGLPELIKAQVDYTKSRGAWIEGDRSNLAGGDRSNLAGGDRSNLAGGNWSNLAGGDLSNLAGGDLSNLAGGNSSAIIGRHGSKARGGINSVICLTEWDNSGTRPVAAVALIVDGVNVKPHTWYTLKNGKVEGCADEE